MSRIDPKNREESFAHQFSDDVKMLMVASFRGELEFKRALATLKAHVRAYESKQLRKACKKAEKEHEEREAWMSANFPPYQRKK